MIRIFIFKFFRFRWWVTNFVFYVKIQVVKWFPKYMIFSTISKITSFGKKIFFKNLSIQFYFSDCVGGHPKIGFLSDHDLNQSQKQIDKNCRERICFTSYQFTYIVHQIRVFFYQNFISFKRCQALYFVNFRSFNQFILVDKIFFK